MHTGNMTRRCKVAMKMGKVFSARHEKSKSKNSPPERTFSHEITLLKSLKSIPHLLLGGLLSGLGDLAGLVDLDNRLDDTDGDCHDS